MYLCTHAGWRKAFADGSPGCAGRASRAVHYLESWSASSFPLERHFRDFGFVMLVGVAFEAPRGMQEICGTDVECCVLLMDTFVQQVSTCIMFMYIAHVSCTRNGICTIHTRVNI